MFSAKLASAHPSLNQCRCAATVLLVLPVLLASVGWPAEGQTPKQPHPPGQPAMIRLSLPADTELRVLIDFVSQRLGVQFLYDEKVANKRVSVRAPEPIPADTLLDVLQSALKMKGLALLDADVEGWKRIVQVDDLAQISVSGDHQPIEQFPGATAVTQAFPLSHMSADRVSTIIEPFLTKQGAKTITLAERNALVVTDYASNLRRVAQLIDAIDQAGPERILEFYQAQHVAATTLAQQVTQSLTARAAKNTTAIPSVTISQDERTNQLMLVGTRDQIDEVLQLLHVLDVGLGQTTEVYAFQYIDAQRIDGLVKELLDPLTLKRFYRSAVDKDDNLLIATGTQEIHDRIAWLKEQMDVETKRPGSAVQFYRLKYADAQQVLATLRAVVPGSEAPGQAGYRRGVSALGRGLIGPARSIGRRESPIDFVPGPNQPDQPGKSPPQPPAQRNEKPQGQQQATAATNAAPPGLATIVPGAARVSVDPTCNAIIVIADRSIQQVYADLIRALDRRRPQVMIEARVVILDTSGDFSFGVEISGDQRLGVRRLLQFTSFGLSQVDAVTGALALVPGRGFNWTLVDPEVADAVLRALASHRRAKVLSAPRILVNDNATGTLASVTEVPFTSVNASNTVATTSFAGFAEAGTTIEATPRITDDDHLQLDFTVSLNSFTGPGGNGVPPPRQTDQVTSSVTIPDGYTVIVGGLTRRNSARDYSGLPLIQHVPILRSLTGVQTQSRSQTTLFVFLRPVILRDDKFRDLKYLSDGDLPRAKELGNFPCSAPLLVR